jgi:hypothetical protein
VAGFCECDDEPSGSRATELVHTFQKCVVRTKHEARHSHTRNPTHSCLLARLFLYCMELYCHDSIHLHDWALRYSGSLTVFHSLVNAASTVLPIVLIFRGWCSVYRPNFGLSPKA